jgi:transcriptional regulator with XRE-family HTH domain
MTTTTTRERAYLRELRKRRKLSQEQLGSRIGVSRNTVGRMEAGDEHTDLTTVMRALAVLRASPWSFCELVVNADLALDQVIRRQNIFDGLTTYIDGIAALRTTLIQVLPQAHRNLLTDLGLTETLESNSGVSELSLLLTLILLDVPREDVIAIVLAPDNHVALGQELAGRRVTFAPQLRTDPGAPARDQHQLPCWLRLCAACNLSNGERRSCRTSISRPHSPSPRSTNSCRSIGRRMHRTHSRPPGRSRREAVTPIPVGQQRAVGTMSFRGLSMEAS